MARIKGGLNAKKKHNRVLKLAKGHHNSCRTSVWPSHGRRCHGGNGFFNRRDWKTDGRCH